MKGYTYKGAKTREISFPIGGIGSGCIGLSGTGHLVDWEIFNRPAKGTRNGFSHFAVKAEREGRVLDARVLHGNVPPPYSGAGRAAYDGFGFGVARETLSGLPHFRKTEFTGGFPFAEIRFRDPAFPGAVTLEAFNPFIPHHADDSSLPAGFFTITIRNTSKHAIDYTAALSLRNPSAGKTVNRLRRANKRPLLYMTGDAAPDDARFGNFAAATDADELSAQTYWYRGKWFDNLSVFWQDFMKPGPITDRTYRQPGENDHGTLAARLHVPAGGKVSARFIFTWYVPNCRNYWSGPEENLGDKTWKNYYAALFPDAVAVARYGLKHWDRLEQETRRFRDTLFRSSLPDAVIDAVSANISILKSPTCLRLEDGSFYGFEGCHADSGCCEGSCQHVWNYAYALPFLFPELERSMRELDYRYNLRRDGGMSFRLKLPLGSPRWDFRPCVDGQFGGVLKTYREWKICGDTAWLKSLWPAVRKTIEFAWSTNNKDRWDPEQTGVLHGRQHHTLDMEFFGPNAWLTGFYLAALKAGAEMATACGDADTAKQYRELFDRGRAWVNKHLFNGEFYYQRIPLDDRDLLKPFGADASVYETYWSDEHGELKYQIGEGCGIDQVLAQWHADLIGLGDVFDRGKTRRALRSIYRYNYHKTMRDVYNPCRLFCLDDEAGTTICAWPESVRRPVVSAPYSEETMHGFEYQAGCHMIMHGLLKEGLAVVKAVRDRYDGERRNPWNEIECGSNYARSMASYALLHAYSGMQFDMTRQALSFQPAVNGNKTFRCFWSLGTAWGEVVIKPRKTELRVLYGVLTLKQFGVSGRASRSGGAARRARRARPTLNVTLEGRRLDFVTKKGMLVFNEPVTIPAGSVLRVKE